MSLYYIKFGGRRARNFPFLPSQHFTGTSRTSPQPHGKANMTVFPSRFLSPRIKGLSESNETPCGSSTASPADAKTSLSSSLQPCAAKPRLSASLAYSTHPIATASPWEIV